jgi:hypothetical protein
VQRRELQFKTILLPLDLCKELYQDQGVSYVLTPRALTSPFSPRLSALRQSGQYHLVVLAGMLESPTHSRWNHSILQFYRDCQSLELKVGFVGTLRGKHLHHYRTESWCRNSHGCKCSTAVHQDQSGSLRRLLPPSLFPPADPCLASLCEPSCEAPLSSFQRRCYRRC